MSVQPNALGPRGRVAEFGGEAPHDDGEIEVRSSAPMSSNETSTRVHTPPQSSRIVAPNTICKDITKSFNQAATTLRHGFLVRDEAFSLFEAVGALEIGDPKMDSGFLEAGESTEAEYDCGKTLSPSEVLWLMDELICREVAWLTGYPLSQTLFTSSYVNRLLWPEPKTLEDSRFIDDPRQMESDPLTHLVFRAYCLALLKSCDLVHTVVTSQHYYEEEDFASQLFHRELLHQFSVPKLHAELQDALSWLETAVLEAEIRAAMKQRLTLRQEILQILSLDKNSPLAWPWDTRAQSQTLRTLKTSTAASVPVPGAFTLKLQQKLASSVPPRPMIKVEYQQALSYFETLFVDISDVFEIFYADGSTDILTAYSLFMARHHEPSVYVRSLLQTFLEADGKILGRYGDRELISDDLQRLVLPDSPLLSNTKGHIETVSGVHLEVKKQLDSFLSKTILPFVNLFRSTCLNRCRVRRTLCHTIIEWDHLQADAEDIDENLRRMTNEEPRFFPSGGPATYSYALSSWTYHHKLLQMEALVQMGFELSVYGPEELPAMYWYLGQLCSVHLSHLDRISFFVEKSADHGQAMKPSYRSHSPSAGVEACMRFLFRIFTRLKATEALANALHLVYTLLTRREKLSSQRQQYASDRLRYELRMRPFLHISIPEPPGFEEFQNAVTLPRMTDRQILSEAQRVVTSARIAWEDVLKQSWNVQPVKDWRSDEGSKNSKNKSANETTICIEEQWKGDVRSVVKACIGTSISIAVLKRNLDRSEAGSPAKHAIPIPGDRDYWHRFWLVPRIEL